LFGCPWRICISPNWIKTSCAAATPRDIHERKFNPTTLVFDLVSWICNIWHRSRTRCIFGEIHQNPSTKCTSHVVAPLSQNILHSMLISDWKIEWRALESNQGQIGLTYDSDTLRHPFAPWLLCNLKSQVCFSQTVHCGCFAPENANQ